MADTHPVPGVTNSRAAYLESCAELTTAITSLEAAMIEYTGDAGFFETKCMHTPTPLALSAVPSSM